MARVVGVDEFAHFNSSCYVEVMGFNCFVESSVFSRFFFADFSALMAAFSASTSARSCLEASFATCDFSFWSSPMRASSSTLRESIFFF